MILALAAAERNTSIATVLWSDAGDAPAKTAELARRLEQQAPFLYFMRESPWL